MTNWGTHRVMFRLPCDLLDPDVVEDYCVGDQVSAWVADEFIVLDFTSEDNAGEFDFDYDAEALLATIVGVRAELAAGDLRPLCLAWLAAHGAWERDEDVFDRAADDDLEPPVPAGLGTLPAAQPGTGRLPPPRRRPARDRGSDFSAARGDRRRSRRSRRVGDPPAGCREGPAPGAGRPG